MDSSGYHQSPQTQLICIHDKGNGGSGSSSSRSYSMLSALNFRQESMFSSTIARRTSDLSIHSFIHSLIHFPKITMNVAGNQLVCNLLTYSRTLRSWRVIRNSKVPSSWSASHSAAATINELCADD
jgi:hypothetical protein